MLGRLTDGRQYGGNSGHNLVGCSQEVASNLYMCPARFIQFLKHHAGWDCTPNLVQLAASLIQLNLNGSQYGILLKECRLQLLLLFTPPLVAGHVDKRGQRWDIWVVLPFFLGNA